MGYLLQQTVVDGKKKIFLDGPDAPAHPLAMTTLKKPGGFRPQWAERLAALRTLTGASQTEFAKAIGMSQQRYGQYELGKAEPNVATWLILADKLNVTVDFIMRGPKTAAASKPSKVA